MKFWKMNKIIHNVPQVDGKDTLTRRKYLTVTGSINADIRVLRL